MRMNGLLENMNKPEVSVIIPTHNRAKMIRRAIRSVLAQTWQDFELIVVSDGSTDNTDEVVASFDDPRIRFLKHETARGASAARNTGIRASKGECIAFLDDDDEWTPNKLEVQVPVIRNSSFKVGLVYAWMEYVRDGKVVDSRKPMLRGNIFHEMLDKQAITNSSTLLVRREVLDVVQGFDEELPRGNDGDFIRRITKHFEVDYVPEVLVKVHVGHERITSRWDTNGIWYAIKSQKKKLTKFKNELQKYPDQEANILASIGYYNSLLPDWKDCVYFFLKALRKSATSGKVYAYMLRSLKNFITINGLRI